MKLLPFRDPETEQNINNVLEEVGLGRKAPSKTANKREAFAAHLDNNNASLEDVAKSLSSALRNPETQLPASRLILEVQGLTKEGNGSTLPSIVINSLDPGSRNNIHDLVVPIG